MNTKQEVFDVLRHMQSTARNGQRAVSKNKVDFCHVHLAESL